MNLTFVPALIPCLRRSSAGTTSWPFDVNVPLRSRMSYIFIIGKNMLSAVRNNEP